jgi:hypothetical protein
MDESFPFLVPDCEVRAKAAFILHETIGTHLEAAASARPDLCGPDEPPSGSPEPNVRVHVPTLDVTDRARVASVRMGPDRGFNEAREATIGTLGHKGDGGCVAEICVHLGAVVLGRVLGPEGRAHPLPLVSIARFGTTNPQGRLVRFGHQSPGWATR